MQLQITGAITGIEARSGGWFAVAITEQGNEYPKKLSTKKPDLVTQAQQMMGQYVTALYNESDSTNINPHSGMPYVNRFLEALAMPGSLPQAQPQPMQQVQTPAVQQPQQFQGQPQTFAQQPAAVPFTPQPQAQQQIVQQHSGVQMSDLREARIMRQSAAKVAVELLAHLNEPDRTLASLVRISEQLVQYFRDGVQWTTPPVQQPAQNDQPGGGSDYNPGYAAQPGAVPAQQAAPQGGVDNYDDIPFAPA